MQICLCGQILDAKKANKHKKKQKQKTINKKKKKKKHDKIAFQRSTQKYWYFFLFLHENILCEVSSEAPRFWLVPTAYVFMEK